MPWTVSAPVCNKGVLSSTTADVSMMRAKRRAQPWTWHLLLLLCSLSGLIHTTAAETRNSQVRQSRFLAAAPGAAPAPSPAGTPGALSSAFPFMPALFVFGDSFVDTGNIAFLSRQGIPFPFGHSPRNEYVMSGRYSNGLILPDYLSQMLGLSSLSTPILEPNASWYYGCNFAFGGSGALRVGNPGPLPDQTAAFADFVGSATLYWRNVQQSGFPPELSVLPRYPRPESFAGGLYLVVIGTNDVLPVRGNMSIVNDVAASLQSTLQTIYGLGGRNFVVASPIDFGCIPFATNGIRGFCANLEEAISAALGEAYRAMLASLQTRLPGATFLFVDLFNLTRTNSSNARPLGFTEPRKACCGGGGPSNIDTQCGSPLSTVCIDPGRHVYWDNIHFSTDFASALAREIFAGNTYMRPKNVLQAFVMPQLQATSASLDGRI